MNQFEKYKLVWKIWTSLKKYMYELEVNLNHNIYHKLHVHVAMHILPPHMSFSLNQILHVVDKTWSPMESSWKIKLEVQSSPQV